MIFKYKSVLTEDSRESITSKVLELKVIQTSCKLLKISLN